MAQNPTAQQYFASRLQNLPPGADLDNTRYSSTGFISSEWIRFYENAASKIGGYIAIDVGNNDPVSYMFDVALSRGVQIYLGRKNSITYIPLTNNGSPTPEQDITPDGWVGDDLTTFSMSSMSFLGVGQDPPYVSVTRYLFVLQTYNALSINEGRQGYLFYTTIGDELTSTAPLVPMADIHIGQIRASGGVVCTPTFVVVYGKNGVYQWTNPGTIDQWTSGDPWVPNAGVLNVGSDIIYGAVTNGEGAASVLFFQVDTLSRVDFVPNTTTNQLNPVVTQFPDAISILAARTVVVYSQTFYWIGQGKIYMFAGVVGELPNTQCSNEFFDTLDYNATANMWGLVQPRFSEIWWYYTSKNSPDGLPDKALVYNVINKSFVINTIGRTAGVQLSLPPYPYLADSVKRTVQTPTGAVSGYAIWQHEVGEDEVYFNLINPIKTSVETKIMDTFSNNPSLNNLICFRRFQPDFIQEGDMNLTINYQMYPSDNPTPSKKYLFSPNTQAIDLDVPQAALWSFVFESDVVGGYFRLGNPVFEYIYGDVRR